MNVRKVLDNAADILPQGDAVAVWKAADLIEELIHEAQIAAARFENLAVTFARMTDRYGDGQACTFRAERLRTALKGVTCD